MEPLTSTQRDITRKAFLGRIGRVACGAGLAWPLAGCASIAYAAYDRVDGGVDLDAGLLAERGFVLVEVRELPAPLYVHEAGPEVHAVLLKCTHRGCTVGAGPDLLECPCHGSQYTPTGRVVRGPAPENLTVLPAERRGTRIHISLPQQP